MAKTIDEGFKKLRSNLEITSLQEATVSTRQTTVRKAIEQDFIVLESFLTGSYKRSTMIAPLSEADIDIFVVLNTKYYAQGQSALLESVKKTLKKKYPSTPKISPAGQAVTITFADFKVDVVPAFNRLGGGYLIPDTNRGVWISTDPKKHVELWSASNKAHSGDLVPLIKMIKGWNKSRSLFRSFHLEVLIYKVFTGITISDFPSGARFFFDKARGWIKVKMADPAGYNDDVAAHINTAAEFEKLIARLDWAYKIALQAEALAAKNDIKKAFEKWDMIFKGYFPTYG